MSDYIKKLAQIKEDIGIIQDSIFFELYNLNKENEKLKAENERVKGIAKKVCEYYERVANTEEICIGDFAREYMKELENE